MVRVFITLMLLAIFFLSGAVYGMKETSNQKEPENKVELNEEIQTEMPTETIEETKNNLSINAPNDNEIEDMIELSSNTNLTQKTASVLEVGVQGFYEAIVNILYGIATLFF